MILEQRVFKTSEFKQFFEVWKSGKMILEQTSFGEKGFLEQIEKSFRTKIVRQKVISPTND